MALLDRCIWLPAQDGAGDFQESVAVTGYQTMESAGAVDGQTYSYVAQTLNSAGGITAWEVGQGAWTLATRTLARTSVLFSSSGGGKINFASPPQVMITALAEDISASVSGANPTATAGPAAVNGSATTFLRSDGAPAIQKATSAQFGIVEVDGTTITAASGVISASGALILAGGNLTFYVATTGNDSTGDGSSGNKWATIQHALNVAANYSYQGLYSLTINVADGTYTGGIILPKLYNYPPTQVPTGAYPSLVGNTTTPANCVISNSAGDAVVTETGVIWSLSGFRLKSTSGTNSDLNCISYSNIQINHIDFAGSGNLLTATDNSSVYSLSGTNSSSTTTAVIAINVTFHGNFINDLGTWTFNNSPTFSTAVANIGDHSILGNGTYVNGNTVTGPRIIAFNYGLIEFTGARSTFPGNGTVTLTNNSYFIGDTNSVLGGYTNTGASLANTIGLSDGAGNIRADYNISIANGWTFTNVLVTNASTTITGIVVNNTSSGGHEVEWYTLGSAGLLGQTVGQGAMLDVSNGNFIFTWDTSANFQLTGALGWSAQTAYTYNSPDVSLSRTAAATLAAGNGTAGNTSGTLQAQTFRSTTTTVAALPTAGTAGRRMFVTDSGVTTFASTPTSGGANEVPVYDDGTKWRVG